MNTPKLTPSTPLERHVAKWLKEQARYDDDGIAGALADLLFRGGCKSGIVSHLIYTRDAVKFYQRYHKEIDALLVGFIDEGFITSPADLNGWDPSDPLAREDHNKTVLAWLGFEETARALATRAGINY